MSVLNDALRKKAKNIKHPAGKEIFQDTSEG